MKTGFRSLPTRQLSHAAAARRRLQPWEPGRGSRTDSRTHLRHLGQRRVRQIADARVRRPRGVDVRLVHGALTRVDR